MRQMIWVTIVGLMTVFGSLPRADALSIVYVPLKVKLLVADCVVIGKIGDVKVEGRQSIGTLKVQEVLKGGKAMKDLTLTWAPPPKPGVPMVAGIPRYKSGQEGVWILKSIKRNGEETYPCFFPGNYMAMSHVKDIRRKLKEIKRDIRWSEAKDGVSFGALIESREMDVLADPRFKKARRLLGRMSIHIVVRNTGGKMTLVNIYREDKPIGIKVLGPDGTAVKYDPYPNINRNNKRRREIFSKRHFMAVAPGKTVQFGYQQFISPSLMNKGVYQVHIQYESKRDGKAFGLKGALQGKFKIPGITVRIPKPKLG